MGWFPPPTGTSLPSEALQASGSSHSLNSIHHTPGGPSSVQLPGMIQPDPLSWGSFRPSTAGQVPGPAFSDSPAYSIQSQTASSGPAQYHLPGLSWIQPTFERSDSLKAETLPPNSPGLGELVPTPHRHVSAPTTPVTAFDPSRSLAISDFQQGFSQLHNPHRTLYLSTTPQNDQLHSPGVPSVSPFVGPSSRPSTSPRLILDNSPVPFLNRTFSTDDAKYEAVLARSHAADRAFVCAATTTRIYCRPSCASKRPDRSRLRFFSNPNAAEQAEAAGFRPCKRCKPQTPGTADQCVLAVGDCARHMVMSARNPTAGAGGDDDDDGIQRGTLKEYSARANLSAFHFHRTFKAVTSVTLGELGKALNTLALQDALGEWTPQVPQTSYPGASQLSSTRASPPPPEEIAHLLVGWSARRARRALGGLVPSVYAAGCPDAPVRYVCAESAFGPVAVAFLDAVPLDGTMSGMPSAGQPSSSPMPVAADEGGFPLHSTGGYLSAPHGTNLGMLPLSPPSNCIFLTCVLGPNAAATIQRRFPSAVPQPQYTGWIVSIVEELHRTGSREVQLPPEVVGAIRRARVWIELQHLSTPKRASSDLGTAPEASVSSTSLDNL
ncbi:hypothetical protein OC846_004580 [Tilletia horrida]|uniref:Ada DNA repair metal-binding domain-containing protein n=1 Tax=Tilletia horrida TaxID=155126 RepID=A0AAN6GQ78_9BASI|nr:hypothetical protein OC846_004580 [Tilletia horrida]KAK0552379.1 hypothetical protein OC845_001754 [Tilletia horrida]KAK0568955.1 hypothetical protein OC861_001392 [Tilletia horrida]